ncbi:bifunctional folylpolyglutamate synthase/dihydrofolate synthase [Nocardioides albus]|uniref:tetrahydrofolate synthase n=1 Tax=Nocardioides albus TaxID=1841 RepID=A0A7W5A2S2_9ACTN|nr:folylpolyglutamate synthase/dihydrofolate synthase family protein [Nocardioides albus]MBB3088410.1 dihydrofolate synthase/folylpolyglutamate synthase [Nocardioides albus]GGU16101.1 dihydrofolate synthase [Nocardioides albus]
MSHRPAVATAPAAELDATEVERQLLARWPETRIAPSLERIRAVMAALGQPQRDYRSIHITGTNGKTSTARMVEAILSELGSSLGRFTSPHLTDIRERISIGGRPISRSGFVRAYRDVLPAAETVDGGSATSLSFFEMTVAMAYQAFSTAGIDVAAVEVGMGGMWDATNVIDAEVAAILPIGLDHVDHLGPTRLDIAAEKAGIIKPGALAVTARQALDVEQLLRSHADAHLARLMVEGRDFCLSGRRALGSGQIISVDGLAGRYQDVPLSLHGRHQAHNAVLAIASVEALLEDVVPPDALRRALGSVRSPGRLEVLPGTPAVILDAAHNPDGARALAAGLSDLGRRPTVAVVAALGDKDLAGMLAELEPVVATMVCTRNSSPRSLSSQDVAVAARKILGADRVMEVDDLADALQEATEAASRHGDGQVLVTGSVVTVGEARRLLGL